MLFQLGTKQYDGVFAPDTWNYSGNEANLAEYPLINTKPRLQHTGETLEEVSFSFQLRAEYCNPDQEISDLDQWKSDGEVLPLLLGNGDYVNDYVIKSINKNIIQTFADGTIVEAYITITLLEFVPDDPQAQQEAADRRSAAAVGDKKQIARRSAQKPTSEAQAHQALMKSINASWNAANVAEEVKASENPETLFDKAQNKVGQAQKLMDDARQKISDVQDKINDATGIITTIDNAKEKLTEIGSLMQSPLSTQLLNNSILNLSDSLRGLNSTSTVFTENIILRRI